MTISAAFIVSTSGLLQIASHVEDEAKIYFSVSGIIFICSILLWFGIKDVVVTRNTKKDDGDNSFVSAQSGYDADVNYNVDQQ